MTTGDICLRACKVDCDNNTGCSRPEWTENAWTRRRGARTGCCVDRDGREWWSSRESDVIGGWFCDWKCRRFRARITQHTGASIRSWTQPAEYFFGGFARPTRVFCVEGDPAAIAEATELIYAAVDRYRALCEMKKRGEFVQRSQKIKGVEFSFQPPPRQITQRQRQLEQILNAQTHLLQHQTNALSGAAAGSSFSRSSTGICPATLVDAATNWFFEPANEPTSAARILPTTSATTIPATTALPSPATTAATTTTTAATAQYVWQYQNYY